MGQGLRLTRRQQLTQEQWRRQLTQGQWRQQLTQLQCRPPQAEVADAVNLDVVIAIWQVDQITRMSIKVFLLIITHEIYCDESVLLW